jgi:hypothetical protein
MSLEHPALSSFCVHTMREPEGDYAAQCGRRRKPTSDTLSGNGNGGVRLSHGQRCATTHLDLLFRILSHSGISATTGVVALEVLGNRTHVPVGHVGAEARTKVV